MKLSQVTALALVGLAGCGVRGEDPHPAAPPVLDSGVAATEVNENLDRLRGLALFEVGELLLTRPRAAERLLNLADAAEKAAATPYAGYACGARIDLNLGTLRALEVVGVGAFLRTVPENNPRCDAAPCPEDIATAEVKDEARAAVLESVALATQGI